MTVSQNASVTQNNVIMFLYFSLLLDHYNKKLMQNIAFIENYFWRVFYSFSLNLRIAELDLTFGPVCRTWGNKVFETFEHMSYLTCSCRFSLSLNITLYREVMVHATMVK